MKKAVSQYISVVLTILYFTTHVALASAPEANFWAERKKAQQKTSFDVASLPATIDPLSDALIKTPLLKASIKNQPLPSQFGYRKLSPRLTQLLMDLPNTNVTVNQVYDSGSPAQMPVLLIQDIHMNLEAQQNISATIQKLIADKNLDMLGVEGAFTPFDFKPFRNFVKPAIMKEVTQEFFQSNRLAAPSYAGIMSPTEPPLFMGIDDRTSYDANVKAYLDSRPIVNRTKEKLTAHSKELDAAKQKTFSPRLKSFDQLRSAYLSESLGFGSYVEKLHALWSHPEKKAARTDLSVEQFLAAVTMEKNIDFQKVERERKIILEKLTHALNQQETKALLQKTMAFRAGAQTYGNFYQDLRTLCSNKKTDLRMTPAFDGYLRYVLLSDGIKVDSLFATVSAMEKTVTKDLAQTPEEKNLIQQSQLQQLSEKLIRFELTNEEWKEYKTAKGPAPADLSTFEQFYEQADLRSQKMLTNFTATLTPKQNSALLIGGFHSNDFTQQLRSRKQSFVVVSPKISKVSTESASAYLSIFAQEKMSIDQRFKGERLFLAPEIENIPVAPVLATANERAGLLTGSLFENKIQKRWGQDWAKNLTSPIKSLRTKAQKYVTLTLIGVPVLEILFFVGIYFIAPTVKSYFHFLPFSTAILIVLEIVGLTFALLHGPLNTKNFIFLTLLGVGLGTPFAFVDNFLMAALLNLKIHVIYNTVALVTEYIRAHHPKSWLAHPWLELRVATMGLLQTKKEIFSSRPFYWRSHQKLKNVTTSIETLKKIDRSTSGRVEWSDDLASELARLAFETSDLELSHTILEKIVGSDTSQPYKFLSSATDGIATLKAIPAARIRFLITSIARATDELWHLTYNACVRSDLSEPLFGLIEQILSNWVDRMDQFSIQTPHPYLIAAYFSLADREHVLNESDKTKKIHDLIQLIAKKNKYVLLQAIILQLSEKNTTDSQVIQYLLETLKNLNFSIEENGEHIPKYEREIFTYNIEKIIRYASYSPEIRAIINNKLAEAKLAYQLEDHTNKKNIVPAYLEITDQEIEHLDEKALTERLKEVPQVPAELRKKLTQKLVTIPEVNKISEWNEAKIFFEGLSQNSRTVDNIENLLKEWPSDKSSNPKWPILRTVLRNAMSPQIRTADNPLHELASECIKNLSNEYRHQRIQTQPNREEIFLQMMELGQIFMEAQKPDFSSEKTFAILGRVKLNGREAIPTERTTVVDNFVRTGKLDIETTLASFTRKDYRAYYYSDNMIGLALFGLLAFAQVFVRAQGEDDAFKKNYVLPLDEYFVAQNGYLINGRLHTILDATDRTNLEQTVDMATLWQACLTGAKKHINYLGAYGMSLFIRMLRNNVATNDQELIQIAESAWERYEYLSENSREGSDADAIDLLEEAIAHIQNYSHPDLLSLREKIKKRYIELAKNDDSNNFNLLVSRLGVKLWSGRQWRKQWPSEPIKPSFCVFLADIFLPNELMPIPPGYKSLNYIRAIHFSYENLMKSHPEIAARAESTIIAIVNDKNTRNDWNNIFAGLNEISSENILRAVDQKVETLSPEEHLSLIANMGYQMGLRWAQSAEKSNKDETDTIRSIFSKKANREITKDELLYFSYAFEQVFKAEPADWEKDLEIIITAYVETEKNIVTVNEQTMPVENRYDTKNLAKLLFEKELIITSTLKGTAFSEKSIRKIIRHLSLTEYLEFLKINPDDLSFLGTNGELNYEKFINRFVGFNSNVMSQRIKEMLTGGLALFSGVPNAHRIMAFYLGRNRSKTVYEDESHTQHFFPGGTIENFYNKLPSDEDKKAFREGILAEVGSAAGDPGNFQGNYTLFTSLCSDLLKIQNEKSWQNFLQTFDFKSYGEAGLTLIDLQATLFEPVGKNNTPRYLTSWNNFMNLKKLLAAMQDKSMFEKLEKIRLNGPLGQKRYQYFMAIFSHPTTKMEALSQFMADNPAPFFSRGDPQRGLHEYFKASNLLSPGNGGLSAQELRDALISGDLDDIQMFRPFIDNDIIPEVDPNLRGLALIQTLFNRGIVDRENLRTALLKFIDAKIPESKLGLQNTLKQAREWITTDAFTADTVDVTGEKALGLFRFTLTDLQPHGLELIHYRIQIRAKSDPRSFLTGNDAMSCEVFENGKKTTVMLDPTIGMFTITRLERDRFGNPVEVALVNSWVHADRDVPFKYDEFIEGVMQANEAKAHDLKLSELWGGKEFTQKISNNATITLDNLDGMLGNRKIDGRWFSSEIILKGTQRFFKNYLKAHPKTPGGRPFAQDNLHVGLSYSPYLKDYFYTKVGDKEEFDPAHTKPNTTLPTGLMVYTDNNQARTGVIPLDQPTIKHTPVKEEIRRLLPEDSSEVAFIEDTVYNGSSSRMGPATMRNELLAAHLNEYLKAKKGIRRPDFSYGYFVNGKLVGYSLAYARTVQTEPIEGGAIQEKESIYISDLVVLPEFRNIRSTKLMEHLFTELQNYARERKKLGLETEVTLEAMTWRHGSFRFFGLTAEEKNRLSADRQQKLAASRQKRLSDWGIKIINPEILSSTDKATAVPLRLLIEPISSLRSAIAAKAISATTFFGAAPSASLFNREALKFFSENNLRKNSFFRFLLRRGFSPTDLYNFYTNVVAPIWEGAFMLGTLATLHYSHSVTVVLLAGAVHLISSVLFGALHRDNTKQERVWLAFNHLIWGSALFLVLVPVDSAKIPAWVFFFVAVGIHGMYNMLAPKLELPVASLAGSKNNKLNWLHLTNPKELAIEWTNNRNGVPAKVSDIDKLSALLLSKKGQAGFDHIDGRFVGVVLSEVMKLKFTQLVNQAFEDTAIPNNSIAVFLAGSYARGDPGLKSDVDFLIIPTEEASMQVSKLRRLENRINELLEEDGFHSIQPDRVQTLIHPTQLARLTQKVFFINEIIHATLINRDALNADEIATYQTALLQNNALASESPRTLTELFDEKLQPPRLASALDDLKQNQQPRTAMRVMQYYASKIQTRHHLQNMPHPIDVFKFLAQTDDTDKNNGTTFAAWYNTLIEMNLRGEKLRAEQIAAFRRDVIKKMAPNQDFVVLASMKIWGKIFGSHLLRKLADISILPPLENIFTTSLMGLGLWMIVTGVTHLSFFAGFIYITTGISMGLVSIYLTVVKFPEWHDVKTQKERMLLGKYAIAFSILSAIDYGLIYLAWLHISPEHHPFIYFLFPPISTSVHILNNLAYYLRKVFIGVKNITAGTIGETLLSLRHPLEAKLRALRKNQNTERTAVQKNQEEFIYQLKVQPLTEMDSDQAEVVRGNVIDLILQSDLNLNVGNPRNPRLSVQEAEKLSDGFEAALKHEQQISILNSSEEKTIYQNFAFVLRQLLTGERAFLFAGKMSNLYRSASETKTSNVAYHAIAAETPEAAWSEFERTTQPQMMHLLRESKGRAALLVKNDRIKEFIENKLRGKGLPIFSLEAAPTLGQLQQQSLAVIDFISRDDINHANFRFILPNGMDLPARFVDYDIDPTRYHFYVMLMNTLNPITLEMASDNLDNITAKVQLILKQA